MAHQYRADLEGYLAAHDIPFTVRKGSDAICANRRHRLEAIDRWFHGPWSKLDTKVKASIVEGVVVFLSLFDENPAVYDAFCPPRSAYANAAAARASRGRCRRSRICSKRVACSA